MTASVNSADEIRQWPIVDGWSVDPATKTRVKIGQRCTIGERSKIGGGSTIGANQTTANLNAGMRDSYIALGRRLRCVKWVTRERKSPCFDGGMPITYPKGAVVECDDCDESEAQCAKGLHVLRWGQRPEWCGLCEADHDYIPLAIDVEPVDIIFAGLPGNDAKLRVRRLTVID